MYKVLIADESEVFAQALMASLPEDIQVFICHDGASFCQSLETIHPDVLVLDLMLAGVDSLAILEAANGAGIKPCVLAVTPYISDYILRLLEQLQVSFVLRKPCNPVQIATRTVALLSDIERRIEIPDVDRVESFLRSLGFLPHLCGYKMLVSALCLMCHNPNQSFTKELYPAVAQQWGTDWKQVEHAIRTCIQAAYKRRDDWLWQMYFPTGKDKKVIHLTNSIFLSCAADHLQASRRTAKSSIAL